MSVLIRIAPDGLHGCKETHARMPLGAERLPCALDEGLITGAVMTEASFRTWPLPPFPILSPPPGPYMQCCGPSMHYPFSLLHLHTGCSFCLRNFCKFFVLQSSDWGDLLQEANFGHHFFHLLMPTTPCSFPTVLNSIHLTLGSSSSFLL